MIGGCPYKQETCPYFNMKPRRVLRREQGEQTGCYSDEHHLYFPAREYKTPVEKSFRDLPENKEQICRWEHDIKHLENDPKKPSLAVMLGALTIQAESAPDRLTEH